MTTTTQPSTATTFSDLTTLRTGGPIGRLVETDTEKDFIAAISAADEAGEPLLVLGGGSNLVVSDEGFAGTVVRDRRSGIETVVNGCFGGANLIIPAGQNWDDVVAYAVAEDMVGVEALSGIPGSVGAAPVQNIGAYGQEISGTLALVRVWDRARARVQTYTVGELGLGYRTSLLKESMYAGDKDGRLWGPTPRYVVLEVQLQLRGANLSTPIAYSQLADKLDMRIGDRAQISQVREAVLALRRSKGMVLSEQDRDSWSAGSFFTNPVVPKTEADALPEAAPRYPVYLPTPEVTYRTSNGAVNPDLVKTSAAWLIEQAGFTRGFDIGGAVALSAKHTLAITNTGGGTTADVVALARHVRAGVQEKFGITLVPEPVLVGVEL